MEVFQLCIIIGGRAVHFLLGKDALCFHTKRSSSQNNSIPSICPPPPPPFDRQGSNEEPSEKDMPPFKLKSRGIIQGLYGATTVIMAVKMADEER